jgi:hypothetical protein
LHRVSPLEDVKQRLGQGRWAGSVHIGYEDGRRVRKHVMGRTRDEVKDKMGAR